MPRADTPSTRLWARYYEDIDMTVQQRIPPGTVLKEGGPANPWPCVAGMKQFTVPLRANCLGWMKDGSQPRFHNRLDDRCSGRPGFGEPQCENQLRSCGEEHRLGVLHLDVQVDHDTVQLVCECSVTPMTARELEAGRYQADDRILATARRPASKGDGETKDAASRSRNAPYTLRLLPFAHRLGSITLMSGGVVG